jgi:uncharacterized protein (TIGR02284 family)
MSADRIVQTLNALIAVAKDAEKGFACAARESTDPAAIQVFCDGEQICRDAAAVLQDEVRILGGHAQESGRMQAAAYRAWVSLKNTLSSRDNLTILEECAKDEDYARTRYAEAMRLNWPEALRVIIERQYKGVVASHARVQALRNQSRP